MKYLFLLPLLSLISCNFISPEKEADTFIGINADNIDKSKYDEIRVFAINKGSEDTIPLHTWEKGEEFSDEIKLPNSVKTDFALHFIGIDDGKIILAKYKDISKDEKESHATETWVDYRNFKISVTCDSGQGLISFNSKSPIWSDSAVTKLKFGDSITVRAKANEGYVFSGWEGYDDTSSVLSFSVKRDIALKANFTPFDKYIVKSEIIGDKLNKFTKTPEKEHFTLNEEVSITPKPGEGWKFVTWVVDGDSIETADYVFKVSGDTHIKAVFERIILKLELTANPEDGGEVIGGGDVAWGVSTSIKASANKGFIFKNWESHLDERKWDGKTLIGDKAQSTTTLVLSGGNAAVRANFTRKGYKLTIQEYFGGSKAKQAVSHAISKDILAANLDSAEFTHWTVLSGKASFGDSTKQSTSVTLSDGDAAIQAVYALKPRLNSVSFSPGAHRFEGSTVVTLAVSDAPEGAAIYYTDDDSEPAIGSNRYLSPFIVSGTKTIRARAFNDGYRPSITSSAVYIKNIHPTLSISSPSLTNDSAFTTDESLTISGTATDDAGGYSISAKLDGADISVEPKSSFSFDVSLKKGKWSKLFVELEDSNSVKVSETFWVYRRYTFGTLPAPSLDSARKDKVHLSWPAVKDADLYIIHKGGAAIDTLQTTTFSDTGLSVGSEYEYSLKVYNTGPDDKPVIDVSPMGPNAKYSTSSVFLKTMGTWDAEIGKDIQATSDGGYLIASLTYAYQGGFAPMIQLIKVDSNGVFQWKKDHKHTPYAFGPLMMEKTADGNFIIASTTNPGNGKFDILLLKVSQSGDELWHRSYGVDSTNEYGNSVRDVSDGYLIGGYSETVDKSTEGWILKTDYSGDTLWTYFVSGAAGEVINDVEYADGKYYWVGTTSTATISHSDVMYGYLNTDGTLGGYDTYGSSINDAGHAIRLIDGYLLVAGAFNRTMLRMKIDPSDNSIVIATSGEGHTTYAGSVVGTYEGKYIFDRQFASSNGDGFGDVGIGTYSENLAKETSDLKKSRFDIAGSQKVHRLRSLSSGHIIGVGWCNQTDGRAAQILMFKLTKELEQGDYTIYNDPWTN